MKKILVLMVLSLVGFTTLFGCESAFDGIKGITCELQYALCSDTGTDIVLCDSIKEKVEQYEKDSSEAKKQKKEISSQLKEVKKQLEQVKEEMVDFGDDRYDFLLEESFRLEDELYEAVKASDAISDRFYGEEGLKLMASEEFYIEALRVAENL